MTEEVYCTDCYYMFYHDEECFEDMYCLNGNAVPWNGAPEIVNGCEPHNCPFFEKRDFEQKVNDNINSMIYDLDLWISEHHKNCDSSLLWKRLGAIEYLRKLKEELND